MELLDGIESGGTLSEACVAPKPSTSAVALNATHAPERAFDQRYLLITKDNVREMASRYKSLFHRVADVN